MTLDSIHTMDDIFPDRTFFIQHDIACMEMDNFLSIPCGWNTSSITEVDLIQAMEDKNYFCFQLTH
jgi:hypothetical protein